MAKVALLIFTLLASSTFASRETYSDGSYTDFEEANGQRSWTHAVPVGGGQYRTQYTIREQYYNYGGFTFRGESYRLDDSNLDGVADYVATTYTTSNGTALIAKVEAKDGAGQNYAQYSDSIARPWSSAWWQGRAAEDARTSVRIYSNAICYEQANGCEMETRCDVQIQNLNQLHAYRVLEVARQNREKDPLYVKVAEMRYERERAILAACKAGARP